MAGVIQDAAVIRLGYRMAAHLGGVSLYASIKSQSEISYHVRHIAFVKGESLEF